MPNHVENHIEFSGDTRQIKAMLESIKNDEYGIGTIDFNKIIPMPESLNIEAGSRTDRGLKAYRDFIEVYTFGRPAEDAKKALKNIPIESESAFLRQRTLIGSSGIFPWAASCKTCFFSVSGAKKVACTINISVIRRSV